MTDLLCVHKWVQVSQIMHPDGFQEKLMLCSWCGYSWVDPGEAEPEVVLMRIKP